MNLNVGVEGIKKHLHGILEHIEKVEEWEAGKAHLLASELEAVRDRVKIFVRELGMEQARKELQK